MLLLNPHRRPSTIVIKKPGRALEIEAKTGTTAVSRNFRATLPTKPDVKKN